MDNNPYEPSLHWAEVIGMVTLERIHQLRLKHEGRFIYTPSDPSHSAFPEVYKLAMIEEEMGEVARNVLARGGLVQDGDVTREALIKELVQVAALSLAWVEGILIQQGGGGG